jgi:hypothetical protein
LAVSAAASYRLFVLQPITDRLRDQLLNDSSMIPSRHEPAYGSVSDMEPLEQAARTRLCSEMAPPTETAGA